MDEQEQVDVSSLEEGAGFDPTLVTVGDWAAQWDELENGWYKRGQAARFIILSHFSV